jgi:hypothetical protein
MSRQILQIQFDGRAVNPILKILTISIGGLRQPEDQAMWAATRRQKY